MPIEFYNSDTEPSVADSSENAQTQISAHWLELHKKLLDAISGDEKTKRYIGVLTVFSKLESYQASKPPAREYENPIAKKLLRYYNEYRLNLELDYLINYGDKFSLADKDKDKINLWRDLICGNATETGMLLEYKLEYFAQNIKATEKTLANMMCQINIKTQQLKVKLNRLSYSLAATLENHYLAIIRAINTAQAKPLITGRDLLTSLVFDMASHLSEEQKQRFLPRLQALLFPVFPIIRELNQALMEYETFYNERASSIHEVQLLLQHNTTPLILSIAKHNEHVSALLKQSSCEEWLIMALNEVCADETNSLYRPKDAGYSPLTLAMELSHYRAKQALEPLLEHAKKAGVDTKHYSRFATCIENLHYESLSPFQLEPMILLHHQIRKCLNEDPAFLSEPQIDSLVASAAQPTLCSLFFHDEAIRNLHDAPGLFNSCLNKISVGYALLTRSQHTTVKEVEINQRLKKASLSYLTSALADIKTAKNLDARPHVARSHLVDGKPLFQFFAPYTPIKINSWHQASQSLSDYIEEVSGTTFDQAASHSI